MLRRSGMLSMYSNNRLYKLVATIHAGVLILGVAACGGRTAPKVQEVKTEGQLDLKGVVPDIHSNGFSSQGGLLGYVGEPVPWDFEGFDSNSTTRRIAVLLNKTPAGAEVEPPISSTAVYSSVRIVWTPEERQRSSRDLEVHLRDLDGCLQELPADQCNNGKKSIPKFDTVKKLSWQIIERDQNAGDANESDSDQDALNASNSNCPQPNSDQNMLGGLIQTGISVLTGGAASLPQLLPGLLSQIGGGNSAPQQQC